jgi:hypothetical protein
MDDHATLDHVEELVDRKLSLLRSELEVARLRRSTKAWMAGTIVATAIFYAVLIWIRVGI